MGCKSTILVSAAVTFVAALVVYSLTVRFTVTGIRDLEESEARANVTRAVAALDVVRDRLASEARAGACLSETGRFIEDGNPAYIDSYLSNHHLFADVELNAIVYRHVSGRVVYSEGWPPDAKRGLHVQESLLSRLTSDSALLRGESSGSGAGGVLLLPEGPLLVAGHPISKGGSTGEVRGTLVLGRFLDARLVQELIRVTGLNLSVHRFAAETAGSAGAMAAEARPFEGIRVSRPDDDRLVGSVLLKDMDGRSALRLDVDLPRGPFRHAESKVGHDAASAASISAVLAVLIGTAVSWVISRERVHSGSGGDECARSREHLERLVQERTQSLLDTERQLFHQEKLASVGQLAAGIAHEINTPIQYIGDNLHALSASFGDLIAVEKEYRELARLVKTGAVSPEAIQAVEEAERTHDLDYIIEDTPKAISQSLEGVHRVSHIVRAMKDFSHIDREELSFVDINHSLESTLTIARNEYKYVADVETDFGELPQVECYGSELNQVFLNILVNAAHAIGDTGQHGKITVRTRRFDELVEISIADTGVGIREEIRGKVFDPFFTTKEVGRGTGQGLSIAHQIVVRKHRGTLTFQSEVGKGTTFFIRVPIRVAESAAVQGGRV